MLLTKRDVVRPPAGTQAATALTADRGAFASGRMLPGVGSNHLA
jgi:hypothetical protein